MNQILAWLAVWSFTLGAIGFLQKDMLKKPWCKILFMPGLLIEALLRLVVGLLTACPITGFSPLGKDKAFLETGDSKWGPPGAAISVGLRGIVLLTLTLIAILEFGEFANSGFALPFIDHTSLESGTLEKSSFKNFYIGLQQIPTQLEWNTAYGLGVTFLVFSTVLAFGFQRKKEFIATGSIWGGLFLVFSAADWIGLTFGFFSRGWFIQLLFSETIWTAFSFLVLTTICLLLLLLLWRSFASLIPNTQSKPKK